MDYYDQYKMPKRNKLLYGFLAMTVIFLIAFLFYRNMILSLLVSPFGLFYIKYKTKRIIEVRKNELNLEFKELLSSLSSSLAAGKPLEKAFENALSDLSLLYPNPDCSIIKETKIIINKLSLNMTIEQAVSDFAVRSQVDDIINFSDVISTCKRTGGNLIEAIKNSSGIINDKIEMRMEIDTMLSSRRFEQKVLNLMPIAIIFIMSLTTEDYMEPVFYTIPGKIAMTICLILLAFSYFISQKIMNIRI